MRKKFQSPRQTRRDFLKKAAVSAVVAASPFGGAMAQIRRVDRIGLHLGSLRQELAADFEGTLEQVAEIGFAEMEFAGYHGKTPSAVRGALEQCGLTSPAAHVELGALRQDLSREIDIAASIGHQYLVVSTLPEGERTLDDYRRHAETLNRAAEQCREAGITIAYHNHDFEFEIQDGGRIGYDVLTSETESDLVMFEMDLFWVEAAGYDPKFYFLKYPGRYRLIHVRDRSASGEMVAVGRGYINYSELFSYARKGGFQHYFVGIDSPADGMDSLAVSYQTVRDLRFNSSYELPF